MRIFAIQRVIGMLLAMSSIIMLLPLVFSLTSNDGIAEVFAQSLVVCLVAGGLLWLPVRNASAQLRLRDGFIVTSAAWVLVSAVGALPFIWGPTKLTFINAFFESTSGLTTTGGTVLIGLDGLPQSLLLYRQSLHFFGGMGIVILAVAILPMLKIGGSQLFRAETSGPVKDGKLTPRIAETAKVLWAVYIGLTVICALAFWVGGMSLLDAINHAFSTISTGGFSTHDASFGFFESPLLELIAIVFMFLGGMNFALHFLAWRNTSSAGYFKDTELKTYFWITVGVIGLATAGLYFSKVYAGFGESLRHAAFHTVSNITTTGFVTTGFAQWPGFLPLLLVLIGFIGGSSGSTSGGLKVVRVLILLRQGMREIKQLVHPRGRFNVKLGGRSVPGAILAAVTGFCTFYILSFTLMTLAVAATGADLVSAFSAVAGCLNNLGPGLGMATMHFQDFSDSAIAVLSFAMILGRLEIFTLLVLLLPGFWAE